MRSVAVCIGLILLGVLSGRPVLAATLEISPVLVTIAGGRTSATLEVRNRGDLPVAIQVRPFVWSQVGDEDVLVATSELILSPPIFTAPAGSSQTIRLLLRGSARSVEEHQYRLLLDEVPNPSAADERILIALRMSIPVFVNPAATATPALRWRAARVRGGGIAITATNSGDVHAVVSKMDVTLADGRHPTITRRGKNPYVLPGAERQWTISDAGVAPGATLRLSVTTGAGTSDQTLTP